MHRVNVTPDFWSPRGEAVVWGPRQSLAVWGGIPGEEAEVKVVHEGQNLHLGTWQSARKPSPHRVDPPCGRYHLCGGCPMMHLDAEGQRNARRQLVRDALAEGGFERVPVGEVVPCPDGQEDFRWVIKLGVGYSDHGRIRVGAWGRRSRSIVPIPECPVAAPPLRRVMGQVAHHIIEQEVRPYDPETDDGVIRSVVLRGSRTTGEVLVTLVVGRFVRVLNSLAEAIAAASEVCGVALHIQDEPGNAIFHRDEETGAIPYRMLNGRAYIEEKLGDVTYRVGPGDFFQTNPSTAERLYADVLDMLDLTEGTPFVDLYCGVGGLALQAAKRTGWALGVEGLDGAVAAAREAAARQRITAEFLSGDVLEVLADVTGRLAVTRPVVCVNPARRGLEEGVVDAVMALNPRKVVYISCNPRALARDLGEFARAGLQVGDVALYDMFPNTAHVESVVVLHAADGGADARRAPRRRVMKKR